MWSYFSTFTHPKNGVIALTGTAVTSRRFGGSIFALKMAAIVLQRECKTISILSVVVFVFQLITEGGYST